jgi:hypothetical protein
LYCIVLYCIVLYCIVLYCIVLYCLSSVIIMLGNLGVAFMFYSSCNFLEIFRPLSLAGQLLKIYYGQWPWG